MGTRTEGREGTWGDGWRWVVTLLAVLWTWGGGTRVAEAQTVPGDGGARPGASVLRAAPRVGAVTVDGILDEEAWSRAVPADGFVQLRPEEGRPASEPTQVRVLVDDDAVYVGARLDDADPDLIVARLGRRDEEVHADWFYAYFDGYRDRRTALGFGVSAAGVQRDLRISDDDARDASWDAVWDAAVRRTPDGWAAELRIPLSQLRFTPGAGGWGVNFGRTVARKNETSHWSPIEQGTPSFVSRFGDLLGVADLAPRRRVEVLPYTVARLTRAPVADANPFRGTLEGSGSVGADVRVGLGPSLTLSATLNPEFGQVEGDPAVLNLTAFETFQQERRPFFVEGADIFGLSFPYWPPVFYSRRIGRAPQGPTPSEAAYADRPGSTTILGALKLTGKTEDGWSIGLVDAVTPAEEIRWVDADGKEATTVAEPFTHYAVARVARTLRDGRSGFGALATAVNRDVPGDGSLRFLHDDAYAVALDAFHRFGGGAWETRAGFQGSHVRGDTAAIRRTQTAPGHYYQRPDAGHVTLDPKRTSLSGWTASANVRKVGGSWKTGVYGQVTTPGFEISDLGFNPTLDHVSLNGWLRYESYAPGSLLRSWSLGSSVMTQTDTDGRRRELTQDLGFDFELLSYWGGRAWVMRHAPAWSTTELRGGPAVRKPGRWMGSVGAFTDRRRAVSAGADVFWEVEDETDGHRLNAGVTVAARPSDRLDLRINPVLHLGRDAWQFVRATDVAGAPVHLVGGLDRRTVSVALRADYAVSPTLSLQTYVRPFVATVEYDAFREVADPGAPTFAARFRDHGVTRVPREGADLLELDRDGDGQGDLELADPSFSTASVQMNTVLRWEYRAGSTLYLVWTHDRDAFGRDRFALDENLDALWAAPARNVLMVKATWWVGR